MPKEQHEDYAAELQKSHDRWEYIYEHGASDPFWEDGCNLNLVRNHIHYYRNKIEETISPEDYPAAYFKKIPPEVDHKYMARPDEIRAAAKQSLAVYRADPNYQYILRHQDDFTPKIKKKLCIDAVLGYVSGLKQFVVRDMLVEMRRHERPDGYLKSFEECVRRMQETPVEEVQLSLFSFSADGLDEPDEDDFEEEEYEEFGSIAMM